MNKQSKKWQRGESISEFAVSVILIILMFLGMLQISAYLWATSIVQNAAEYGARAGSVAQGGAGGTYAASAAKASLSGAPLVSNVQVEILAPGGVVGDMVKIRVSADIPLFMPAGASLGLGDLRHVQAVATFRQEGW